ncbi:hypothetical protein AB0467_28435 [Streptomyces sp. NPDC052095]|uniref:hypothetical protein n=1 Tax=unclassified Streptomyces TaxID=2593676 RepID=UPI00344B00D9
MNVPVGAMLAGLAVPYVTSVVRTLTRRGLTDRAERLLRTVPGLGVLAVSAAVRWPDLARAVPVPVDVTVVVAVYLLAVSVSMWCLPPEACEARRAAHTRLVTPWVLAVPGAFLIAVAGPFYGLLVALVVGVLS